MERFLGYRAPAGCGTFHDHPHAGGNRRGDCFRVMMIRAAMHKGRRLRLRGRRMSDSEYGLFPELSHLAGKTAFIMPIIILETHRTYFGYNQARMKDTS
jgi:hypothetical protein